MKWTKLHELKALLIYKKQKSKNLGEKNLEILKSELANDKTFPENSFNTVNLKLGNILYLDSDGREGLSGYSEQCKAIYDEHKDTPIEDLEALIKSEANMDYIWMMKNKELQKALLLREKTKNQFLKISETSKPSDPLISALELSNLQINHNNFCAPQF